MRREIRDIVNGSSLSKTSVMSISEQEELLDDSQRRAGQPIRSLWRATTSPTSW
jgi:hypothetical protein